VTRLRVGSVATLSAKLPGELDSPAAGRYRCGFDIEVRHLGRIAGASGATPARCRTRQRTVPSDPERPLYCRFLGSQSVALVGPARYGRESAGRLPDDLQGIDLAVPGPRHAVRAQFDALCAAAGITARVRAKVDDMAMLRLIARDSGWLTVLPEVVVQDELHAGSLVVLGTSAQLQNASMPSPSHCDTEPTSWSACSVDRPARSDGGVARQHLGEWLLQTQLNVALCNGTQPLPRQGRQRDWWGWWDLKIQNSRPTD